MRIYTRTGDAGETGLVGGARVSKDDLRMEVVGGLDELNAAIGVARLHVAEPRISARLERLQRRLFDLGAEIATDPDSPYYRAAVTDASVAEIEAEMDALDGGLEALRNFILPGGSPGAAHLHQCRTVCRRVERLLVALGRERDLRPETRRFVNRLSDWMFMAARVENRHAGLADVIWQREEDPE